jgi:hypothetical protein
MVCRRRTGSGWRRSAARLSKPLDGQADAYPRWEGTLTREHDDLRRELEEAIARAESGERKRRTHEEKAEDAKLHRSNPDVPGRRVAPSESTLDE